MEPLRKREKKVIQLIYANADRKQSFEIYYDKLLKHCPDVFTKDYTDTVMVTMADISQIAELKKQEKKIIFRVPHITKHNENFIRYMLKVSDKLIFQSNYMLQVFTTYFGQISSPSMVVHNAVESQPHCAENDHILICGDYIQHPDRYLFETNKAVTLLQTLEWLGGEFYITVAGSMPGLAIPKHIKVISGGTQHIDLQKLRMEHGIYIHTTLFDNCPNNLLEAMASCMLCVGYRSGGVPEVLPDSCLCYYDKDDLLKTLVYVKEHSSANLETCLAISNFRFDQYQKKILNFVEG